MVLHYIKFAFRNLLRNKVFSLINIIGLAIGLACSFFITIYVVNEISYDKILPDKENIYRVLTKHESFNEFTEANTAYCLGPKFMETFPEVDMFATHGLSYGKIQYKEKSFSDRIQFATSNLFNVLSISVLEGDKTDPLKEKDGVYLSSAMAKKLFGEEDPLGKIIEFTNRGIKHNVIVKGLFDDFPWNSTFKASIIAHIDLFIEDYMQLFKYENIKNNWSRDFFTTYLKLKPNTDLTLLRNKIKDFEQKEFAEGELKISFILQNINDIYLHSKNIKNNNLSEGNLSNLYTFSGIALLILLIAGFNYIILSTAKASSRSREIGIRKVIGANRKILIKQLLLESILLVFLSLPIAYILVEIFTPQVHQLFAQEIDFKSINMIKYILLFLGITLLIGLLSGSYIAFYTSSFKPIDILKNNSKSGKNKLIGRKIMIVVQLMIFIGLLISSLTIYKQISFAQNTDLGFNKKNIVKIEFSSFTFNSYKAYINSINNNPAILSTSYSSLGLPTESYGIFKLKHFEDENQEIEVKSFSGGPNYMETFGIKLKQGRFLSDEYGTDIEESCMLNETAVKELGIKDPLNEKIEDRKIVGIVEDFNVHSLRSKISPILIQLTEKYISEIIVKISPENQTQTLQFLEEKWKEIAPNQEFNCRYIDEILSGMYGRERRFAKTTIVFTIMAIVIACLGLFGLTLFIIQKRSKEIGIRKIHGASINNIMMMINKEFAVLVVIATILAWPVAWYLTDKWLQSFAYTIDFPYELYILSGFVAMIIVLLTVSIRSLKAAISNPVNAIRYE